MGTGHGDYGVQSSRHSGATGWWRSCLQKIAFSTDGCSSPLMQQSRASGTHPTPGRPPLFGSSCKQAGSIDTQHAPRRSRQHWLRTRPRRASLGSEAVAKGCHLHGQLALRQNLVHAHAAQRDLSGARQAHRAVLHAVDLQGSRDAAVRAAEGCNKRPGQWQSGRVGCMAPSVMPASVGCSASHRGCPGCNQSKHWPPHLRVLRARLEAALFKHRLAHEVGGHHGREARSHHLQENSSGILQCPQSAPGAEGAGCALQDVGSW